MINSHQCRQSLLWLLVAWRRRQLMFQISTRCSHQRGQDLLSWSKNKTQFNHPPEDTQGYDNPDHTSEHNLHFSMWPVGGRGKIFQNTNKWPAVEPARFCAKWLTQAFQTPLSLWCRETWGLCGRGCFCPVTKVILGVCFCQWTVNLLEWLDYARLV